MSPSLQNRLGVTAGFPRVSGDEPDAHEHTSAVDRFSPRERG